LALYLAAKATLEFILAYRLRPLPGSGWLFFDGMITLVLAIMIWRTWPASTAWAIGILVGISMLFSGISRLMLSLAARRLLSEVVWRSKRVSIWPRPTLWWLRRSRLCPDQSE